MAIIDCGVLQACAPQYKYFFSKFDVIEPVGTCYYARDGFETIEEFAPCRQEREQHRDALRQLNG